MKIFRVYITFTHSETYTIGFFLKYENAKKVLKAWSVNETVADPLCGIEEITTMDGLEDSGVQE